MMWHWNSLWAPAPGDPPAVDDPALWRSPWSLEQAIALQARGWETFLSASRSWWTLVLSTLPAQPNWPLPDWASTQVNPAAHAGIEPLVMQPERTVKTPAPRKRAAKPVSRSAIQARKR